MCHICNECKTPFELVSDKLVMSLDGLKISILSSKIYHLKYTTLATGTIVLDDISNNYSEDSIFEDVIYENYSAISYGMRKMKFTVCRTTKEFPVVLKLS